MELKLGTRASKLALWQANWTKRQLEQRAGHSVEIVEISTQGDRDQAEIQNIGAQGLFTKEIQKALLAKEVDLAVHSLKDLPTDKIEGLKLAAVPVRARVNDVLIAPGYESIHDLPQGAKIGTSSLRRQAQLLHFFPDFQPVPIRGNVETRLEKVETDDYDAIVLAAAGLDRLQLFNDEKHMIMPLELVLPAVGQGALGIESRDEPEILEALAAIDYPQLHAAVIAERAMLAKLEGGCLAPIAAFAHFQEPTEFTISARVLDAKGKRMVEATALLLCDEDFDLHKDSVKLGEGVAEELCTKDALKLIASSRAE